MKLKLKEQYLDTTISFNGKTYYLRFTDQKMYQHFYSNNGLKYLFEEEAPAPIIKEKKKKED